MSEARRAAVARGYGEVAARGLSSRDAGISRIARAFGYAEEELAAIPAEANMGLSCGNPVALASLRPGETVVDLGSGGGLDVFLAAGKVGPEGRAIGIDMTEAMVDLARRNAIKAGIRNVAFHRAPIEHLPLPDASVDCVLSNCVLNLVEDKPAAFAEIARVLKPGGRLAASDIALSAPLPPAVAADVGAWISCIAGAIPVEDYAAGLEAAGFEAVRIQPTGADLNVYKEAGQEGCCGPAEPQASCCGSAEPSRYGHDAPGLMDLDLNAFAQAVRVFAVKP